MRGIGVVVAATLTTTACSGVAWLSRLAPIPHGRQAVYLTFDADMNAVMRARLDRKAVTIWYDPALIDYLAWSKTPATIFVTGLFAETYPDLIKRLSTHDNFTIGNHTYDHAAFTEECFGLDNVTSERDKLLQIQRAQQILTTLTGKPPRLFRFPGLCHANEDDRLVANLGLKIVDADIVAGDAFQGNSELIVDNVTNGAKHKAVILMHTGGPNAPASTAALKIIIERLRERGFIFGRL